MRVSVFLFSQGGIAGLFLTGLTGLAGLTSVFFVLAEAQGRRGVAGLFLTGLTGFTGFA